MNNKTFFKKVYDRLEGKYSRVEIERVLDAFSSILTETIIKNETVSTTIGVFKTHKDAKKLKKITFVPKEEKHDRNTGDT